MTSRPRIAVARNRIPGGLDRLVPHCDIVQWDRDAGPTTAELAGLVKDCDGLLVTAMDKVDTSVLEASDRLRLVAVAGAGYDGVDLAAARRLGITVTNSPGTVTEATADLAFTLILLARRRIREAMDAMYAGDWKMQSLDGWLGHDVYGGTLGVVGYGDIGRAVARRAKGFGMTVLQHSRTPRPEDGIATAAGLDELLAASDVVSLHVPLSAATEKLIGARELALMKPTATLVNTARGGVLDEAALLEALRTKKLHSAGLDVMDGEPRNDVSEALFREPRVTLLPHIGSATDAARAAMVGGALDNLVAVLVNGDEATTPVR